MRSLLFLVFLFWQLPSMARESQQAGWLVDPSERAVVEESDDYSEQPSSQQLIDWMSTASHHGIDIPQKKWLQLASDPSPQNVRIVANAFASYLDTGVLDKKVYQPGWMIDDRPALGVLQGHMDSKTLNLIEPRLPQYQSFKKTLGTLEKWLEKAVHLFPESTILEEGDKHSSLFQLNQWLIDLDLAERLSTRSYSAGHVAVIKAFQKKQHIWADGQLGPRTRQALVALTHQRIKSLKINMERLRWLPRELPYPHVMVDIAGFNVAWVKGPRWQKRYKAIVGKPSRQTPVFQEEIESITVNPPWRVPSSIASTSLLRKAQRDPSFLKKEGFVVYDSWKSSAREMDVSKVDWRRYNRRNFPYRLEQKPGRVNRLGRYKLDSPNSMSIYLHDTDKPELFDRSVRTFSSGCTRVENIEHLIGNILKSQNMSGHMNSLKQARETGKLKLRKPVPVYFVYFTAWPDSDGRMRYRDDIYRLDDALTSSL